MSFNSQPPAYQPAPSVPAAGNRVPTASSAAFPPINLTGPAPFRDVGGEPVFVCSALFENGKSVHPAKAAPHLPGFVRVPYGGIEMAHKGRFDILPITDAMEWVAAGRGQIPKGRRPVEGGYEENGAQLFHALVTIPENGLRVPGKTGVHLGAAHCAYGGGEHIQKEEYDILCWKY